MLEQSYTFDEVKKHVEALAELIVGSNFKPQSIVAVARGGWIPARLLSDCLNIKEILSIGIAYADKTRTDLVTYSTPSPFPKNERVLIIEDCVESGRSIEFAERAFSTQANDVRTAALFVTETAMFVPDYYLKKVEKPPTFPWEHVRTGSNVSKFGS